MMIATSEILFLAKETLITEGQAIKKSFKPHEIIYPQPG
jgi:predicted RNase H-like HicB family nuclease